VPILLVLVALVFSALQPESYGTWDNFRAILDTNSVVVILALGAMLPLVAGEFDLSVPANAGMANVIVLSLTVNSGHSVGFAICVSLLASLAVGLLNGYAVVFMKVPAFIATLGMASILQAVALVLTDGGQILNGPENLTDISRNELFGLPLPAIYMLVIALLFFLALNRLPVGRRLYAVGGNRRAAELSGVPVSRYLWLSFAASGLLAGVGGIIIGARLGSATVDSTQSLLLPVFAAAFLGATTIQPGRFNTIGTIVSVYFLALSTSGLQHQGAPVWVEPLFYGVALILAVSVSGWAFRRRTARARKENLSLLVAGSAPGPAPPRADSPTTHDATSGR
jgi:ribose transport system permease protein